MTISVGDIVLAKYEGFSYWPAKIITEIEITGDVETVVVQFYESRKAEGEFICKTVSSLRPFPVKAPPKKRARWLNAWKLAKEDALPPSPSSPTPSSNLPPSFPESVSVPPATPPSFPESVSVPPATPPSFLPATQNLQPPSSSSPRRGINEEEESDVPDLAGVSSPLASPAAVSSSSPPLALAQDLAGVSSPLASPAAVSVVYGIIIIMCKSLALALDQSESRNDSN